jgi:hypothetical protein
MTASGSSSGWRAGWPRKSTSAVTRALVLLTGRLADFNREIDSLEVADAPCTADQIAARRARRRAGG